MNRKGIIAGLTVGVLATGICSAACDLTLNPGANVAAAALNAAPGSTICLNSGSYGSVLFSGLTKNPAVTIQSSAGQGASLFADLANVNGLNLSSMTLTGLKIWTGVNRNIQIRNNKMTGQALVSGSGRSLTSANILLDGNSFDGISVCDNCYEGRLQLYDAAGVVISNNHFGGNGNSDGIQWGGYGGQVGPGNVFEDIVYLGSRHVDAIQLYGDVDGHNIVGNFFRRNSVCIMAPDGAKNVTVRNNVFAGDGNSWGQIQMGSHIGDVFEHNTLINIGASFDKKSESTVKSENVIVRNNLLVNSEMKITDSLGVSSCVNCTFDSNMFTTTSSPVKGSNSLIAPAQFVGGATPTTWAGYQVSSTSQAYKSGSDGKDRGSNFFGGATPPPAPAPAPSPAPAPAPAPAPGSVTSGPAWNNSSFAAQSEKFQATFDMIPNGANIDAVTGLSNGASTGYTSLAAIVRFNSSGAIDARNGADYSASTVLKYAAGKSYRVKMIVDVPAHVYDVYVTPAGGTEVLLAKNFSFRTEQASVSQLNSRAIFAQSGSHSISNFNVSSAAPSTFQSLLSSLVPQLMNESDGANVHYELGMKFTSNTAGKIMAIRFYKSSRESGTHMGKIYSSAGALLASVTFSSESPSGWQEMKLATPLAIAANTVYTVSVNTGNTFYVTTVSGMAAPLSSANLKTVVGNNGVFGPVGRMPTSSWNNSNYFRDVVFLPN